MTMKMAPNGSKCVHGKMLSLPSRAGVSSPYETADRAWANSWTGTAMIRANKVINIIAGSCTGCSSFLPRRRLSVGTDGAELSSGNRFHFTKQLDGIRKLVVAAADSTVQNSIQRAPQRLPHWRAGGHPGGAQVVPGDRQPHVTKTSEIHLEPLLHLRLAAPDTREGDHLERHALKRSIYFVRRQGRSRQSLDHRRE